MRSYHSHLQTFTKPAKRPVFRASGIFPVIQTETMTSRVLFMGYWILKRNIEKLSWMVSLRDEEGKLLYRNLETIEEPKTFRIELSELLKSKTTPFRGSIECEFFSNTPLVFPFPALVLNYYGSDFSTLVHTAQRIYNDAEDRDQNSVSKVPEAGFNIYTDHEREPFIGIVNGPDRLENFEVHFTFINHQGKTLPYTHATPSLQPYETLYIFPKEQCDLNSFLEGKVGTAKAFFSIPATYPRLIAGNMSQKHAVITHTYYDCSDADAPTDYWRDSQQEWHGAALMLPVQISNDHFTTIYFYPIYSPSHFIVNVEFYRQDGERIGLIEKALTITSPSSEYHRLELKSLAQEAGVIIEDSLTARITADPVEGTLPARVKIGYDIGNKSMLPCNICTNLVPFMLEIEKKPHTFKWAPVLDTVWIVNSSPQRNYTREADVTLTFYREDDAESITQTITLPANGFHKIEYADYSSFFNGKPGWMTAVSKNPYILTYYFVEGSSGVIGGDHGF